MNVLGIETSCDETSAAVVRDGRTVLSNVVFTQIAQHRPYGGVVPEIASRCHVEEIAGIVRRAVDDAKLAWTQIDAVGVTYGPGLASSLLVGLSASKALALRLGKPLFGVNHIEAHLYSLFLGRDAPSPETIAPLVVLMVSGGHTLLVRIEKIGAYQLLGQTLDDAAGEALDKGANLLKLGYPGGPAMEQAAIGGDPAYIRFPRGLQHGVDGEWAGEFNRDLCFSFSGLKTSLLYYLKNHPDVLASGRLKDVAASYQEAVLDALLLRLQNAVERHPVAAVGCVGGVARNGRLRQKLDRLSKEHSLRLLLAQPEFCTDNAAMIAALVGATGSQIVRDLANLDACPDLTLA